MKRLLLSVAVGSALGLVGCDGDSQQDLIDEGGTPVAFSRISFDPGSSVVPLPNDLLFNGTLDGTLVIPGEAESGDYTDPEIALGALDGWSTTMPISIDVITINPEITLDPTSAQTPGTARLFEVTLGGPLSPDSECTGAPTLTICKVGDELVFGQDFVTTASGNALNVVPISPLKAGQGYAVITTDALLDSGGQVVAPSTTYELLKQDFATKPLPSPDQQLLQQLTNNYEQALAAAHGVTPESITYSGVFTTQSVFDSVATVSQLMADGINPAGPSLPISPLYAPGWEVPPTPTGLTAAMALGLTPEDGIAYVLADLADVYFGQLSLPYYQSLPSLENGGDINGRWMALGDSPIAVLQAVQGGGLSQESFIEQAVAQGIDPSAALTDPSLLVGASFTLDNGEPADPDRHITRYNPVPAPMSNASVPVQITVPNAERLTAFYASQGVPWTPPAAWPITQTLHGLGGVKELNLAYAGTYAVKGVATISIDMPLHGERSVDLTGDGIYEVSATDPGVGALLGTDAFQNGTPLAFVNLGSTLTVRDNFRQGITDHLGVRLALNLWAGFEAAQGMAPTVDVSRVSLQGLSLGGIVGTSAATYTTLWNPALGDNPYSLTGASLVAPAGGLAGVFAGSPTFGPVLLASLVAELAPQCIDPMTGGILPTPECEAVVAQIQAEVIPPFAFAAQTAVDAMDPINHAAALAMAKDITPVHLIEVVGNLAEGGDNLPDQVLPNTVEGFPLSGTEPLISALGLPAIIETTSDDAGRVNGAVRFAIGAHSSLINPDAATVEMQTQVADFALTDGRTISIGDGCLIQGGDCAQ